jgi:hypothetical protein
MVMIIEDDHLLPFFFPSLFLSFPFAALEGLNLNCISLGGSNGKLEMKGRRRRKRDHSITHTQTTPKNYELPSPSDKWMNCLLAWLGLAWTWI